jgi:hypothetical protein
LAAK